MGFLKQSAVELNTYVEYVVHLIWANIAWWARRDGDQLKNCLASWSLFTYLTILVTEPEKKKGFWKLGKGLKTLTWTDWVLKTQDGELFLSCFFFNSKCAQFSDNILWLHGCFSPPSIWEVKESLYFSNCCPAGTTQDSESDCPRILHGQLQLCSGKVQGIYSKSCCLEGDRSTKELHDGKHIMWMWPGQV